MEYDLRQHIAQRPLVGTTVLSGSPSVVEQAAMSPFQAVCVDAEHSALSIDRLEHLIRAADAHGAPTIVRAPEAGHYIGRVLDLGAAGIIVPRIETAADVRDVVERSRFAPEGKRGAGPGRGSGFGYRMGSPDYSARANARVLVTVQIETAAALEAIDEITVVPGLDAVVIGPFDLALSVGVAPGSAEHGAAIDRVIASAAAQGIASGAFCFSERDVAAYTAAGSRVLLVGGDLAWVASGLAAEWELCRRAGAVDADADAVAGVRGGRGMRAPKVVMTNSAVPLAAEAAEILGAAGIEFEVRDLHTEDDLIAGATDADGLLVIAEPITPRVLAALSDLKVVTRFGIGLDSVDVPAAEAAGVWVTNVPDANYREVAVHAIALALAVSRRIPVQDRALHETGIARLPLAFGTRRPDDQVFGLLGFGRIGRRVAEMARAIGYRVRAADPMLMADDASDAGVELVSFDELVDSADILSLHVPLTPATEGIIGAAELARLPRGAVVVNVSRGGLIDEPALLAAIASGHIAGAGLDAYLGDGEPMGDNPLRGSDRVILTPHSAHFSEESLAETKHKALRDLRAVLEHQEPRYAVNRPVGR